MYVPFKAIFPFQTLLCNDKRLLEEEVVNDKKASVIRYFSK